MNASQPDFKSTSYSNNGFVHRSLNERIEEVITKRQSLARKVQPVHQHLGTLHQEIISLNQRCQTVKGSIHQPGARVTLETIDFPQLETAIRTEQNHLQQLIDRFSRPTLNLGVIGRMRQGKSTFLQRLSGLTDNEIPARTGGACTAVRSKICHHDGETEAIVTWHSERSFLDEVIAPYYKALKLGHPPNSLDEFASASFYKIPQGAVNLTMYDLIKFPKALST